ncbi:MAG: hypothetical protein A3G33_06555 [Omnitrophica bacterium RIFCSPLOWO2_12_FULL_44_17]|uniref:Uncharacterized protein n=1 Tax=Candidatus Danuiimicrobium aquiferis TaxID=1801832 RepID=A0A1G1L1E1_9BACT|nr:MAG: hypothetical protein A3B72_05425 [Omnitrophica bacterium RIFCSPHIGHO2_02_FULL_45_28]OGW98973.1 MAG: hypothetical protein A3G33_06555 [Omnitrophica bacterium RIFCSPLOWO2_12_FULL_44_17]OGX01597.1 MAG: hypothetical protein A3J12_06005 [Omnitrophica bacterium RIFCSPLOWO2_02_FULL_44_11]
MNLDEAWKKALKQTQILRSRVKPLQTHAATQLPYIFLAASKINVGDTVVRKGEIAVEKPSLILPQNTPQFEGFNFEEDFPAGASLLNSFFLIRGIRFPSYHYNNKIESLDVFEGNPDNAIRKYQDILQKSEDLHTGLIMGAEDCWQFSIIIFICSLILRQAEGDIQGLMGSL